MNGAMFLLLRRIAAVPPNGERNRHLIPTLVLAGTTNTQLDVIGVYVRE